MYVRIIVRIILYVLYIFRILSICTYYTYKVRTPLRIENVFVRIYSRIYVQNEYVEVGISLGHEH